MSVHGNTQGKHWCFTLNNYDEAQEAVILALEPECDYIVYGYETAPSTGTHHLQGLICFKSKLRFTQVRTLLPDGTHIEPMRGTLLQASDYCKKEGMYQERGVLPNDSCCSVIDRFKVWVREHFESTGNCPTDQEIALTWTSLWLRQRRHLSDLARFLCPGAKMQEGTLRHWQADLKSTLDFEPDDRTIIFVVDEEGGKGKTWFQRWYFSEHPDVTQILSVGKRDDVAHAVDETKSVFMFNVPRGGMEFFQYHVVEMIKDRLVFSPKYDSRMKVIRKNPHVVIFCNEEPDRTKMTEDRYFIIRV